MFTQTVTDRVNKFRKSFISNQVFEALQPLFFLTFLYGLTPFRVTKNKGGETHVQMSFFGFINIAVYILLYGCCYIISLLQDETIVGYFFRTKISNVGDTMQTFNGLVTGAVIYISAVTQRGKILRVCRILHGLDTNFASIGIKVKYSRIYRYCIVMIIFQTVVIGIYFAGVFRLLKSMKVTPSFCVCVTFFLQHSVLSIAICLFCIMARSFERRLVILNKRMDEELTETPQFEANVRSRVRRFFSAKRLYECLQPLLFFTYWHGLTPFYVTSDSKGTKYLKLSIWGYINVAVHIVVYTICYIITLTNDCETVAGYFFRSRISQFGDFLQILSGFIGVTVIYLTAIIPKHYVQRSLTIMQTMDEQLKGVGIKIMYSKVLRFSYIYILFMVFANLGYTIFSFQLLKSENEQPSASLHVTFVLQHTVVLFALALYSCFTKMIQMRLSMMNWVLKNLCHQWDTRTIKTITHKQRSLQCLDSFSMYTIVSKNPTEIIQESMEIHQLICEAASTANKYFTYQLLTIISIAFLIIVFDAYYVLETLLGKSKRESKFKTVEFVTFFSCQMILYLIAIISIVEGSNRAIKKSEKTGGIVHALLNKAKSQDVKEKLQQFSMQLLHLKINFTAAGLFNIDRTLYFTISGALTTYLIILLQFTSSTPTAPQNECEPSLATVANRSTT